MSDPRPRLALTLAGMLLLTAPLSLAPSAAAHCPSAADYKILVVVRNCDLQGGIEAAVDALNAAGDGLLAFVVTKDRRFHPDTVNIKNGGTVVFLNFPAVGVDDHDPRASGGCASGAPRPNPETCVPRWRDPAVDPFCFDVKDDTGGFLDQKAGRYPVTLRVESEPVTFLKSHGYLTGTPVGTVSGAQPFQPCQPETGTIQGGQGIIPYHCGIHGIPGGANGVEQMRGVIVVEA